MLPVMCGFDLHRFAAAAALAAVVAAGGCGPAHRADSAASATASAPRAHRPAPPDPDLTAVIERYYELIEGAHWPFAYAMLSARYRASLSQPEFEKRYASLIAPHVKARQVAPTTAVTRIDAHDAADRTRMRRYEETVKFVWDGEEWKIDRIDRREVRFVPSP
ncbi:MAG TPA: hypothetical protein VHS78_02215 [Candidatus Elarobacter sp.]|jgi:hypothetical protein|nr:hypothetical protein [Candidatus Elarobacter sp.]